MWILYKKNILRFALISIGLFLLYSCKFNDSASNERVNASPSDTLKKTSIVDSVYQKEYFENGKIKLEGYIIDGKKYGLWKEFSESGQLTNALYYFEDVLKDTLDTDDFILKQVFLSDLNIALSVPSAWITPKNKIECDFALKRNCAPTVSFCTNVVVTSESETLNFDIQNTIERLKSSFDKFRLIGSYEGVHKGSFNVTYTGRKNNVKLGGVIYTFVHKEKRIFITFMGNNDNHGNFAMERLISEEIFKTIVLK